MPGEFEFIDWVKSRQKASDRIQTPAGDDLAVLSWAGEELLLVGTDQVLDGVHFDSAKHSPRQIGAKAMNRNLSDCAAMGCLPAAALLTMALPNGASIDYAKELYLGAEEASKKHGCEIVGGDTGTWPGKLSVTITVLGRGGGTEPVTRSRAKVGDMIFVSGPLGGSILGRHMTFEPQVVLGGVLARQGVTAMIDLSDGLSRDLRHICQTSGVGAIIEAARIPIHQDAHELFRRDRVSPLDHALNDGEDYELLFTGREPQPGFRIGRITAGTKIELQTTSGLIPLDAKGWEHSM